MLDLEKKVIEKIAKFVKQYGKYAEKSNSFSVHCFYRPEAPTKIYKNTMKSVYKREE